MRFLTRGVFVLAPTMFCVFAFGVSPAASETSLQSVNLSCNDGTNLDLALDTTALTELTNAVSAINLYPAGDPPLSCALDPAPSGSGNPNFDYTVGGGQLFNPHTQVTRNFSFSVHAPDTPDGTPSMTSGGTLNLTRSATSSQGTIVAKPDCLTLSKPISGGQLAEATGTITQSTGSFSTAFEPGTEVEWDMFDSGMPAGLGDRLMANETDVEQKCRHGDDPAPLTIREILHGNVTVHDADS
jgi:hypothetical protein